MRRSQARLAVTLSWLLAVGACSDGVTEPASPGPVELSSSADLSVAVQAPSETTVGDLFSVAVRVENAGPDAAQSPRIVVALPAGVRVESVSNSGMLRPGMVEWSPASLPPGPVRTFTATLVATGAGDLVVAASATASTPDPDPADNDGTGAGGRTTVSALPMPPPEDVSDGWAVVAPAQAGLDAAALAALSRRIDAGDFLHVHALLVARRGRLAYDDYFNEHTRSAPHGLQSVTKSVGSLLVGITADQGLARPDDALPALLPERAAAYDADPAKREIRLRDLLSMRAGLRWDEWTCPYQNQSCNSNLQMNLSPDWIGYVLDQPVVETPGARFVYNSGASNLLGAIVRSRTGRDPVEFAHENLFGPLDIAPESVRWFRNAEHPDSLPHFGGGLRLRSRDLAKIAQLVLDGGVWRGRRVVSEEWIGESTRLRTGVPTGHQYGWQWWLMSLPQPAGGVDSGRVIFGWGYGGQHVFIVPALDLVVATNSWNPDGSTRGFQIFRAVLEAVR